MYGKGVEARGRGSSGGGDGAVQAGGQGLATTRPATRPGIAPAFGEVEAWMGRRRCERGRLLGEACALAPTWLALQLPSGTRQHSGIDPK